MMRLLYVLLLLLASIVSARKPGDYDYYPDKNDDFHENQRLFTNAMGSFIEKTTWRKYFRCDQCRQLLRFMKDHAGSNEEFVQTAQNMCSKITISHLPLLVEQVCNDTAVHYGPIMATVLRTMGAIGESKGADMLCNTWAGVCPIVNPRWKVPLEYRKKHRPRPKASGQEPFKFVRFSDLHIDPYYRAGQRANCPSPLICCRAFTEEDDRIVYTPKKWPQIEAPDAHWKFTAGPFGHRGLCDSPDSLQRSMYEAINRLAPDVDFAIFNGGVVSRQVWNSSVQLIEPQIQKAYDLMSSHFDFVYPAVGNDDSSPGNTFPKDQGGKEFSQQWLYDSLARLWSRWIGNLESKTVSVGGYYSTKVPSRNLRIISLNTNFYTYRNLLVFQEPIDPDPGGQMKWLINELEQAERAGEYVYIIGHMAFGDVDAIRHTSNALHQIVNHFQSTIKAMFFGHAHFDQFQLHYEDPTTAEELNATAISYIAPSLTPVHGVPSFQVFEVDPETLDIMDINTYWANMNDPQFIYDKGPVWRKSYSVRATYGGPMELDDIEGLTPSFWHKVSERFEWDENYYSMYFNRKIGNKKKMALEPDRANDVCLIRGGRAEDNCVV